MPTGYRRPQAPSVARSEAAHLGRAQSPPAEAARPLTRDFVVDLSAGLSNLSSGVHRLLTMPVPTGKIASSAPRVVQRQLRLDHQQVAELARRYEAGDSVRTLSAVFGVNRETILEHLKREGIERRPHIRKLTDRQVGRAASLYASGLSLAKTAEHFDVSERTLRSELAKAGHAIRPRRGWPM